MQYQTATSNVMLLFFIYLMGQYTLINITTLLLCDVNVPDLARSLISICFSKWYTSSNMLQASMPALA